MAHSLGRALLRNNYVTSVELNIGALTATGNYESLLRALEESTTLTVVLLDGTYSESSGPVAERLLRSISSSKSVKTVFLRYMVDLGPHSLSSLLDSPVEILEIRFCSFSGTLSNEQFLSHIPAQLRSNRSLVRLELCYNDSSMTGIKFAACVGALEAHPTLRHLTLGVLSDDVGDLALVDLGHVLSSSHSVLKSLELKGFTFTGETFAPVAHGLESNHTVNTLEFDTCVFTEHATQLFIDLMDTIDTIRKVHMNWTLFFDTDVGVVMRRILLSNTTLEHLSVNCEMRQDVPLILEALHTNTTLQSLSIGREPDVVSMCRSLPKVRGLKKLSFPLWDLPGNMSVNLLLQAFQSNGSLVEVEIDQGMWQVSLDADALARIQSFCQRNRELPILLSSPLDMAPSSQRTDTASSDDDATALNDAFGDPFLNMSLRPKAYIAAQRMKYGNDLIFHDLLYLADRIGNSSHSKHGPSLINASARRGKRKRCAPSNGRKASG